MTNTNHYTRVSAPPEDGSAGWRCSCGVSGIVEDYDAEFLALRAARQHVESARTLWVLSYSVPDPVYGHIDRAEGPYPEDVAMARRAEIWDSPLWADLDGGATVEMIRFVTREDVDW